MGRREDFDNALWSDPDFLALSPEARMTYIWSWTNPRCGMAGLYKVAPAQAALETGYPVEAILGAFVELAEAQFAFYERNVVFVRTRARRLRTKSEQIAKSVRNDLMVIADDHPLKGQFLAIYADQPWLRMFISGSRASINGTSGEAQGNPPNKPEKSNLTDTSADTGSTPPGNGNGSGKGNVPRGKGAGKGAKSSSRSNREPNMYTPSAEALALIASHFPDEEPGTIDSILAALRQKRMPETPGMVRGMLGRDDDEAAAA